MRGGLIQQIAAHAPQPVLRRVELLAHRSPRARDALAKLSASMRHGTYPIASGPAKGMLMDVAGSRPSYLLGTAEPEFVGLLAAHVKPGDTVFDLGANVGYFTLIAAALTGKTGNIVAYEPSPANLSALRQNVTANSLAHVEVVAAAVGAREGTAQLWLDDNDQAASITTARDFGSVDVRTVSLDEEVERVGMPKVIKSDIEGAEFEAFTAARRTLAGVPVLLCETHGVEGRNQDDLETFLAGQGFQVRWLFRGPWTSQLVATRC